LRNKILSSFLLLPLFFLSACGGELDPPAGGPAETPQPLAATYNSINSQIFQSKCMGCHAAEKPTGQKVPLTREGLLNSPRELVVPGDPETSGLMIAITREDDKRMPPPRTGAPPLTEEEIRVISQWIVEGAEQ
jgi:uncharacterized membrane protein